VPFEEPARFNAEVVRALRPICIRPQSSASVADGRRHPPRDSRAGSIYGLSSRR
jgi:hypothetical protein